MLSISLAGQSKTVKKSGSSRTLGQPLGVIMASVTSKSITVEDSALAVFRSRQTKPLLIEQAYSQSVHISSYLNNAV